MKLPDFLTRDPDGEIRLAGHRIGLYTVARLREAGCTPEQIAEELPSLTRGLIEQVLAFCAANLAEVDAYVAAYQKDLERLAAAPAGTGVNKMRRRMELLEKADARHGSEPGWSGLSVQEKLSRLESESPCEPV